VIICRDGLDLSGTTAEHMEYV